MAELIQKAGYIKPGRAGGYMKYIATREGVEPLDRGGYMSYIATRPPGRAPGRPRPVRRGG